MKKLTEFERGYVAGVCEAAGTVYFAVNGGRARASASPHVRLSSRHLRAAKEIYRILGCGHVGSNRYTATGRRTWYWRVTKRNDLLAVLPIIRPLVPRLRKRIDLMLEFLVSRQSGNPRRDPYSKREREIVDIFMQMQQIRGVSDG